MVNDINNMIKDLRISPDEVTRMTKAFENPHFKELFLDYVKDIENPGIFQYNSFFNLFDEK